MGHARGVREVGQQALDQPTRGQDATVLPRRRILQRPRRGEVEHVEGRRQMVQALLQRHAAQLLRHQRSQAWVSLQQSDNVHGDDTEVVWVVRVRKLARDRHLHSSAHAERRCVLARQEHLRVLVRIRGHGQPHPRRNETRSRVHWKLGLGRHNPPIVVDQPVRHRLHQLAHGGLHVRDILHQVQHGREAETCTEVLIPRL
mmetsp:Transcript_2885/g.8797  ORF Transcript_2885/g.8797 Transcript_2885/m.8797 type:complete len:201 (-) Transcript_2885:558-1160(-)